MTMKTINDEPIIKVITAVIISLVLGVFLGYVVHLREVNNIFLSSIVAFQGILIGVTIPISLQVVSWGVDRFDDSAIAEFFTKEKLYRIQYFLFIFNIVLGVYVIFINLHNKLALTLIFIWFIVNIYFFYKFILMVEKYIVDLQGVVVDKIRKEVDEIFEED